MPTPNALPDAAVARFRDDLTALIGPRGPVGSARIGIAVSGGSDSLGLLLLAHAAFPGQIRAATVDHRLRAESADEAAFVAAVCTEIGVPHATFHLTVLPRGNRSARAREARYAVLDRWAADTQTDWIATGHHAEDQMETVIMRLNRASGVGGLAGIRAVNGRLVRPLLGWRRREIAAVVAHAGLTPIDDPSNRDDRYDRARLRKALAGADWIDPVAVAKSAALLAEADTALDWASAQTGGDDPATTRFAQSFASLPPEILRRSVLHALRRIDPACQPRGEALTRLIAALQRGGTATIGRVKCTAQGDKWVFEQAAARRAPGSS